jgi:hypothetical protein
MIIEKKLAVLFWVGVVIVALLVSGFVFHAWAEQITSFTNDKGHECYIAMTLDYEIYHICYPSLDDRLAGETSYSSIPDLTFGKVVIDSGNTQTSPNLNDIMGLFN